jgi:hypothetical protein
MVGIQMFEASKEKIREASAKIVKRGGVPGPDEDVRIGIPDRSVLEQFAEERPVEIAPTDNVRGFMVVDLGGARRSMVVPSLRVGGVPVRLGDRVRLARQTRTAENGDYVVTEVSPLQTRMESPIVLSPSSGNFAAVDVPNDGRWRFTATGGAPEGVVIVEGDRVYWSPMQRMAVVTRAEPHSQRTDVLLDKKTDELESEKFHPLSMCSSDPFVPVKELCEAKGGWWDRPCVADEECPFFGANHLYQNYRGGCISGYCEMPIGTHADGYHHFKGTPVCHGRGGECDASKDYAFEMDQFERRIYDTK